MCARGYGLVALCDAASGMLGEGHIDIGPKIAHVLDVLQKIVSLEAALAAEAAALADSEKNANSKRSKVCVGGWGCPLFVVLTCPMYSACTSTMTHI